MAGILTQAEFKKKKPKGNYNSYLKWMVNKSPNPKLKKAAKTALAKRTKPKPKGGKGGKGGGAKTTGNQSLSQLDQGINSLRTANQLRGAAAAEIDAALSQELRPMNEALVQARADETADDADINKLFQGILPFAQAGANEVETSYDEAYNRALDIGQQTGEQLTDLRGARQDEAMQLAQTIGGGVNMADFTQGVDVEQAMFKQQVAGDLLLTLAEAEAGAQEANAFATQVLPLVQTENINQIHRDYNRQITGIQREIADIKASRGDRVNARFTELLADEREFALAKTQQDRDWKVAQQSLKNEAQRLEMERTQLYGVDKKGNLTLDGKALALQDKNQKKLDQNKLKQQAGALLEKAMSGSVQKVEGWIDVQPNSPGAVEYAPGKWGVWKSQDVPTDGMRNPDDIYDYLVLNGIPPKMAANTVRLRFGYGKQWKPHNIPKKPGFVGGPTLGNQPQLGFAPSPGSVLSGLGW
jgi:hypothetical protein